MAANDDKVDEPSSTTNLAARLAAIVGLGEVATDTITLFLEILGWSVVAAPSLSALQQAAYNVVFIDELLFADVPLQTHGEPSNWGRIVLVGPPSGIAFIGLKEARVCRADLPLDLAQLETIIASSP